MNKTNHQIKPMVVAALMLALAYVLPNFTGNIPQIGSMLLPMHLPVLLCGFLCGGPWGAVVGFVAPLLRSVLIGMPPMFPTAVSMAFELATYGFVSGFLYQHLPKHLGGIYASLIGAMLCGRVVWGIVRALLTLAGNSSFTFSAFLAGAFTTAIPGIVLQLVAIPVVVAALQKAKLISQTV
ncbi:MAG: ECF transporter S component [Lawsonibacter sp.]|nr:ECF transporter S component [Lawsonibacter sp.]